MSDDDEILEGLVVEAQEHADIIDGLLNQWSADPSGATADDVNQVFRSLHTIKGGFGFFGLNTIKELAHAMESLLGKIRDGDLAVSEEIVDVLLAGLDRLRSLVEDLDSSNDQPIDDLLGPLNALLNGGSASSAPAAPSASTASAETVVEEAAAESASDIEAGDDWRPTPDQFEEADSFGQYIYQVTVYNRGDLKDKMRTQLELDELMKGIGDVLDVRLQLGEMEGLGDCLITDSGYQVMFMTMCDETMLMAALDIPRGQIDRFQESAVTSAIPAMSATIDDKSGAAAAPAPQSVSSAPAPAAESASAEKPAPAPKAKSKDAPAGKTTKKTEHIRVPVPSIEKLLNLAGELVLGRNQLRQSLQTTFAEVPVIEEAMTMMFAEAQRLYDGGRDGLDRDALLNGFKTLMRQSFAHKMSEVTALTKNTKDLDSVVSEIQDTVMGLRLQPVSVVFNKVPPLVRKLARDLGKQIHIETNGADVELDKTVIEALSDPLTHLLRNSCDHGIETPEQRVAAGKTEKGNLTLSAVQENGWVCITIHDDGKGIDPEIIKNIAINRGVIGQEEADQLPDYEIRNLIFAPGFSTAEVVSDVSGRGVGMDVVKSTIERLGGSVEVESVTGEGSIFTLRLPLTLAIIQALLVQCGNRRYAIPQVNLKELVLVVGDDVANAIEDLHGSPVFRLRDNLLPVVRLREVFGLDPVEPIEGEAPMLHLVIIEAERGAYALLVDRVNDTSEIVVKPLIEGLGFGVFAGATVLGDASMAPIIDTSGLAHFVGMQHSLNDNIEDVETAEVTSGDDDEVILLRGTDDQSWGLMLDLVERLEVVKSADVERVGNSFMVRYRDTILPLLDIENLLSGKDLDIKRKKNFTLLLPITTTSHMESFLKVCAILFAVMT